MEHHHGSYDVAGGIANRRRAVFDTELRAVARYQGSMIRKTYVAAADERLINGVLGGLTSVLVDDEEDFGQWLGFGVRRCPAGHGFRDGI